MQDLIAADLAWIPIAETKTQWAYSVETDGAGLVSRTTRSAGSTSAWRK